MKKFKIYVVIFFGLLFLNCTNENSIEDIPATEIIEPVTYLLLNFTFTPQTDTVNNRVEYQVEFFNINDFEVTGFPKITLKSDGILFTTTPNADCQVIASNSSCILSYDVEDTNPLIFPITFEFVSAEYVFD